MFMHSCCCDEPNPLICDPFEDPCGTALLWSGTGCSASVDRTIVCPRWCSGGGDIGPIDILLNRSVEIEFDPIVLQRFDQGLNRYFRGDGVAQVKLDITGQTAREEFEDCYGGQSILVCPPFQASFTHTVTTKVLISCAQEQGTLAQFAANPCVVPPQPDEVGYLTMYASSCYKFDAESRFYRSTIVPIGGGRYICDQDDGYLSAPRSGWLWYAYYKVGDCVLRNPPLIWRRAWGGFANFTASGSSSAQVPCVVAEGTVFTATDSDFAVRTTPTCEFDWERNESWSAVFPGSCEPPSGSTYGPVPNCNAVLSGYCQQTSVQMGIPGIA